MATLSSSDQSGLIVLAIIVLIMARRTYMLSQGARYGPTRIFAYGAFSMFLFAYLAGSTIYLAWAVWGPLALALLAPYLAIIAAAAWAFRPVVERHVKFETRADGAVYYRLPVILPVLTLVFFLARVGAEIALFGVGFIATLAIPAGVTSLSLAILIALDLLFGTSIGMLIGRGLGVRGAYAAQHPASDAPLASKPA
jgi:hypothetical protein